jgi:hypothetical protein
MFLIEYLRNANADIATLGGDYFSLCYGYAARVKGKGVARAGVKLDNLAASYFDKAAYADFGSTQNGTYFYINIATNVVHL